MHSSNPSFMTKMIKKLSILFLLSIPLSGWAQKNLKLWYKEPAKTWTEALPLGNGKIGAMVFGGVEEDLIQLNDATYWSGGPVKTNVNPNAYESLLLAREALLKNADYGKANEYAKKMQGYYSESYLPLGDLRISQKFKESIHTTQYQRSLNISEAIATTKFAVNGVTYQRQLFTSAPDQVMVIKLTASKAKALDIKISTSNPLKYENAKLSNNEIAMFGKAPSHAAPVYVNTKNPLTYEDANCRGMRYALRIKGASSDGQTEADSTGLHIFNATEIIIYVVSATSFNGFDQCPASNLVDEKKISRDNLAMAAKKGWTILLNNHLRDFYNYFNRVNFELNNPNLANNNLPTNERLMRYAEGAKDPSLETLYFQYGRYLLISSSRQKGVPANLQGIWNNEVRPPWSSNYTTNINVQMNYWPAEAVNLSEMHLPFLDFIKNASITGAVTAKEFYHTNGWAVHHNSDIWALSNPVGDLGNGDPMWANWTMGSPWLAQHLWWHYEFTQDKNFLKNTAYPLMKGAAEFCLDFLITDEKGNLITAPSVSPENEFIDEKGKRGTVSIATTMDMSIIWDLFTNIIAASKVLGIDQEFRKLIIDKRDKLYTLKIGKNGDIQEWYKDWKAVDPHHRHVSHLFGLFPGKQISPILTPEYAAAAKKTLELRGDAGTGWSLAWKINFWAKLLDGDHAYTMIRTLLRLTGQEGTNYANGGGTYANLFDAHPPFQIDGNFGAIAGMTEMLLQSEAGEIYLLPALPTAWSGGAISGLKARGNFEVGINWKLNKLVSAQISSLIGGKCKIRTNIPIKIEGVKTISIKDNFGYVTSFLTSRGKKYNVVATN